MCAMLATPVATAADTSYQFDLPAQSLAEALRAVGRQTSTNILFETELVENVSAPALRAQLTVPEALERLLSGTRLIVRRMSADTVVVRRDTQRSEKIASPVTTAVPARTPALRLADASADSL